VGRRFLTQDHLLLVECGSFWNPLAVCTLLYLHSSIGLEKPKLDGRVFFAPCFGRLIQRWKQLVRRCWKL